MASKLAQLCGRDASLPHFHKLLVALYSSSATSAPAVTPGSSATATSASSSVADPGKKKKWGLSVLVLLLPCAATFGLGTWQLYRRNSKIELLEFRRKRLEEEPILLETVLATSRSSGENFQSSSSVDLLEYRQVVIQGKYDESKSLFVGPRVQTLYGEAKKGYQMVTPFIYQSQNTEAMQVPVLVNQGWVPASMRDEFLSHSHQETDETSKVESHKPNPWWNWWNKPAEQETSKEEKFVMERVVGVIRDGEHPNMFVPHNQPEIGQWFYVDVPAMAQTVGLPPDVTYIEAVSTTGGSHKTFPLPKEPDALLKSSVMPQDHLNYSLTWYSLSAATTFMAVKRLQSQKRGR